MKNNKSKGKLGLGSPKNNILGEIRSNGNQSTMNYSGIEPNLNLS